MASLPAPLERVQWWWLLWNVVIPTFGPTLLSLLVLGMWKTGDPSTELNLAHIADLTPWALCFFALTLIGSSYSELDRPLKEAHPTVVGCMVAVGICALLYAAVISLLKQKSYDVARAPVYYVTAALWIGSVLFCYRSYVFKAKALAAALAAAKAQPAQPVQPALKAASEHGGGPLGETHA